MTVQNLSQGIVQSITAVTSGTIASGGFLNLGTASIIDNTPNSGTVVSGDLVDVWFNFGTAGITLGAGSPNLNIGLIPSQDGTTFITPGTTSAAAPSPQSYSNLTFTAAVVVNRLVVPNIPVLPKKNLLLVGNNLGVAIPTGTTIIVEVKNIQNW